MRYDYDVCRVITFDMAAVNIYLVRFKGVQTSYCYCFYNVFGTILFLNVRRLYHCSVCVRTRAYNSF